MEKPPLEGSSCVAGGGGDRLRPFRGNMCQNGQGLRVVLPFGPVTQPPLGMGLKA